MSVATSGARRSVPRRLSGRFAGGLIDLGDYDAATSAYDRSARVLPNWPSAAD